MTNKPAEPSPETPKISLTEAVRIARESYQLKPPSVPIRFDGEPSPEVAPMPRSTTVGEFMQKVYSDATAPELAPTQQDACEVCKKPISYSQMAHSWVHVNWVPSEDGLHQAAPAIAPPVCECCHPPEQFGCLEDGCNCIGYAPAESQGVERARPATREKRLEDALIRLRDCDWVISLPDRMDAVRAIAREALEGE